MKSDLRLMPEHEAALVVCKQIDHASLYILNVDLYPRGKSLEDPSYNLENSF